MDDTLTQIAEYFYLTGKTYLAKKILELPEFKTCDRRYLQTKNEISELLRNNIHIEKDLINEVIGKLEKLTDVNIDLDVRLNIFTILYLEELYINKNTERALTILNSLPADTNLSIRQNLSSLLLQNGIPQTILSSIHWVDIMTLEDSRALLVENLFKLLPSKYITPNSLNTTIKDALSYRQLFLPTFGLKGLPTNIKFKLMNHSDEVWFIRYSPDGRYLATGSKDRKVLVYDANNSYSVVAVFQLHTESITYISWNASSTEILTLSFDQTLRIWSIAEKKCISEFDNKNAGFTQARLSSASFSPKYEENNHIVVASNDGKLFILDKVSGDIVTQYKSKGLAPQIQDFVIQNDTIWAITLENDLLVFELSTLNLMHKIQLHQQPVAINSVSSSFPGILKDGAKTSSHILINLKPNALVLVNTTGISTTTSSINQNTGKLPYIGSFFYMPTVSKNNHILRGCAGGNYNPKNDISSSGIILSGGQNGEIWIWGYEGNVIGCIKEHEGLVNCVSWRNDGYSVNDNVEWASASDDGSVCIWNCSD